MCLKKLDLLPSGDAVKNTVINFELLHSIEYRIISQVIAIILNDNSKHKRDALTMMIVKNTLFYQSFKTWFEIMQQQLRFFH